MTKSFQMIQGGYQAIIILPIKSKNDIYQRETLSEGPIRQLLILMDFWTRQFV